MFSFYAVCLAFIEIALLIYLIKELIDSSRSLSITLILILSIVIAAMGLINLMQLLIK